MTSGPSSAGRQPPTSVQLQHRQHKLHRQALPEPGIKLPVGAQEGEGLVALDLLQHPLRQLRQEQLAALSGPQLREHGRLGLHLDLDLAGLGILHHLSRGGDPWVVQPVQKQEPIEAVEVVDQHEAPGVHARNTDGSQAGVAHAGQLQGHRGGRLQVVGWGEWVASAHPQPLVRTPHRLQRQRRTLHRAVVGDHPPLTAADQVETGLEVLYSLRRARRYEQIDKYGPAGKVNHLCVPVCLQLLGVVLANDRAELLEFTAQVLEQPVARL